MTKDALGNISKKDEFETSFLREHIIAFGVIIGIVVTIMACATLYYSQVDQLNEYRNGILKGVQESNPKCDWLKLVVSVDGNGLWSLDPLESKIHQLAQSKLDKGDCK